MSLQKQESWWTALVAESRPTLRLAGPVVAGELAWMSMNLVDTLMVGRVSAEALGAVSVGHVLFNAVLISGCGLLFGLDTIVSQAVGAGNQRVARNAYLQSLYLGALLAPILTILAAALVPLVADIGVHPAVVPEAVPYMEALTWCVVPLLLYMSTRRYLQAQGIVTPIMIILVAANLVNVFTNWIFIFGHLGSPAYGTAGAGWATFASLSFMAVSLVVYAVWRARRDRGDEPWLTSWAWDGVAVRRLLRLGWPVSIQILLEIGVFGIATVLIATMDPVILAAHQVALNMAALTYMVPLGVSAAAAVRVGHAVGGGNSHGARLAGWTALACGGVFMFAAGIVFICFPALILGAFTRDSAVVVAGLPLLRIAAGFQLVDGLQVVATGALRGAGDTTTPMVANLIGHWAVGLPIGWLLAFRAGWDAQGIWTGLLVGLGVVATALLLRWGRIRPRVIEPATA